MNEKRMNLPRQAPWLLLLSLGPMLGCGAISARHQHISIDSKVRGGAVAADDGKPLGRTPLFHKIKRSSGYGAVNINIVLLLRCPETRMLLHDPVKNSSLVLLLRLRPCQLGRCNILE